MNHVEFVAKLKEQVCMADWHHRYYTIRANKYYWIDYALKGVLGVIASIGAVMAGTDHLRPLGAIMAGSSGFILGAILPNFKWDTIVSGLKQEREDWARILQGFGDLQSMWNIADRDEMFMQEYQKVEELRKAAQLNDRNLPEDKKLRRVLETEIREYYKFEK